MQNKETDSNALRGSALVDGNNEFAFNLYRQATTARSVNLFLSPFSISTALAMVFAGARSKTQQEMAVVLGMNDDPAVVHPQLASLIKTVFSNKLHDCRITLANRVWTQAGYQLRSEYTELLYKYYGAGLASLDFREQPGNASQLINRWVAEQTGGNIKNLISPQDLDERTRLVLTNAIYFRGEWTSRFRSADTKSARFSASLFHSANVRMMHQENQFAYGRVGGVQILELPYGKRGLSMMVLLPGRFGGLAKLERSLSVAKLNRWLLALEYRTVRVYLPRFRMRARLLLVPTLRAMGMVAACSETEADFSGITDQQPGLWISSVIHEAFVEVDEQGTEAAAATALTVAWMQSSGYRRPPRIPVFRADHPFVFLIRHVESGAVLFLGRVTNPQL